MQMRTYLFLLLQNLIIAAPPYLSLPAFFLPTTHCAARPGLSPIVPFPPSDPPGTCPSGDKRLRPGGRRCVQAKPGREAQPGRKDGSEGMAPRGIWQVGK